MEIRLYVQIDQRLAVARAEMKCTKTFVAVCPIFLRPFGAGQFRFGPSHGLRRGLYSCAASRLSLLDILSILDIIRFSHVQYVRSKLRY